jgi:hypothetical protein
VTEPPRACARCGTSLEGRRANTRYCDASCRFAAWLERHPEQREQRVATIRAWRAGERARKRPGAHGERGARIYFTAADLVELRDLVVHASPRLIGKVADASERVE